MDNVNDTWSEVTNSCEVSDQFVVAVPPSQSEDILSDSCTDLNTSGLKNLPGLHPKPEEDAADSEVIESVMDPNQRRGDDQDGAEKAVLVMDSEVESKHRTAETTSDEVHTVEESVSEGVEDVTVIPKDVEEEGDAVKGTPSVTVPSLQLSAEPMLVPETVDEEDQKICPSPDAYGDVPLIIPNSPTLTPDNGDEMFNPMGTSTLDTEHHRRRQPQPSASQSLVVEESQEKSQISAESPLGRLTGPTLAGEIFQQSQSLNLHLTESGSGSQARSQPLLSQLPRQEHTEESQAAASQSQGVELFEASQNLRLSLTPSQTSQPSQSQLNVSGEFKLSVPRPDEPLSQPSAPGTPKETAKSSNSTSSGGGSAGLPVRTESKTKAPITIATVHSESQSASEPTFKLDRPDTSHLTLGQQSIEREESAGEMSVFTRTRQGTRHIKMPGHLNPGEESSADFPSAKREESENDSSSSSLPCSQNRPSRDQSARAETEHTPMEVTEAEKPADVDVFGAETVMDSEPEGEEESTQSYKYPALSRSPAAVSSLMEEDMAVEEIEVPVLPDTSIATLRPSKPSSQPRGSQGHTAALSSPPAGQRLPERPAGSHVQTRHSQQALSQQASQRESLGHSQQAANLPSSGTIASAVRQRRGLQRENPKKDEAEKVASQEGVGAARQSQGGMETGVTEQQVRHSPQGTSQDGRSQHSPQKRSQEGGVATSQRASQKRQQGTSGGAEGCSESSQPAPASAPHNPGPAASKTGHQGKETTVSQSTPPARQLFSPQADPYTFHGSQSQLQEGADNTSRAETSVSTLRMRTRDGMSAYKRKRLIKKKNESNPREPEVTSPSTDETAAAAEGAGKPARKGKRTPKFTKLQKGKADFKKPQAPEQRLSSIPETRAAPTVGTETRQTLAAETEREADQPVLARAAGVSPPVQPVPGTSRQSMETAGASQEQPPPARKRRSVEFASPLHSFREQSLSDSQSSDTMLEETSVREVVFKTVQRYITVRRYDGDGKLIDEKQTEEKCEPVIMEETETTKKRKVYAPLSPSRSGSTLTSGDLGDISSSSLSLKTSSGPSSLEVDRTSNLGASVPEHSGSLEYFGSPACTVSNAASLRNAPSTAGQGHRVGTPRSAAHQRRSAGDQSAGQASAGTSPAIGTPSLNQSSIAHDESRHEAVVTSSSSGRNSDPLYSADNLPSNDLPCAQRPHPHRKSSASSSPDVVPPTAQSPPQQGGALRTTSRTSSRSTKRMAADSSQEGRQDKEPLSAESQAFQPGSESGGFSVRLSAGQRKSSSMSSSDSADRTIRPQVEATATVKSGSSDGEQMSLQIPLQGSTKHGDSTPVVTISSQLDIGAHLMARWKDGFFYPATFRGLNTGIGNKFRVLFEDGLEKTVRAIDLIMAQHLPIGQSVLVSGDDDLSDPGMIIQHVIEGDEVLYMVAMDNGSTKKCPRRNLLLTEDQASCLLSDEELRVSFGEKDGTQLNTADVSLDNVILGKRLRIKGSPAVAVPSTVSKPSTSAAPPEEEGERESRAPKKGTPVTTRKQSKSSLSDSASSPTKGKGGKESEKETSAPRSSNRKRKGGPVATSTPTPKQKRVTEKQGTPTKADLRSPLGAAVSSPSSQKRPGRKARTGLFENTKGPMPEKEDLFEGYTFILTYIDKPSEVKAAEKNQLRDPSLESSAEESTDEGAAGDNPPAPFDKDHLTMQIEGGGGVILKKFPPQLKNVTNLFVLSDTYHRTAKYLQALAGNIPTVSHMWIVNCCKQNQRLDHLAYVLPAGISLEKYRVMERTNVTCLKDRRILLTSSNSDYLEHWRYTLELAQCKVFSKFAANATKNRPGVDVMVTDADCVPSLLEKARKLEVPVVGSEWVIQCLINNKVMKFDGHPNYMHQSGLYNFLRGGPQ